MSLDPWPPNPATIYAGRRVWDVEECPPLAEGWGEPARLALAAHYRDARGLGPEDAAALVARAREGRVLIRTTCPCPAVEHPEDCTGDCDCGGYLPPCGDEWRGQVLQTARDDEAGLPVLWEDA